MKDNRAPRDQPQHSSSMLMCADASSATTSNWSAVRSALVAEVLRRQGRVRVRLQVYGESMLPALWPGDVVEIESCRLEELGAGDIVFAQRDERLFLHRLVADRGANGFVLRGDCMRRADLEYPPEALLGRLVRGTRERRDVADSDIDSGSRVQLTAEWLGANWSRAIGMFFWHCGWARRLALRLHGRKTWTRDLSTPERSGELSAMELNSREIASSEAGAS